MCELLVRVKDKGSDPDPAKDALISKRGHVIACMPDGWGWTKAERENPDWVIIKMPGVDPNDHAMMASPVVDDLTVDKKLIARRQFTVALDSIPTLKNLSGAARGAPVTMSAGAFNAAKVEVPVRKSFEVIG